MPASFVFGRVPLDKLRASLCRHAAQRRRPGRARLRRMRPPRQCRVVSSATTCTLARAASKFAKPSGFDMLPAVFLRGVASHDYLVFREQTHAILFGTAEVLEIVDKHNVKALALSSAFRRAQKCAGKRCHLFGKHRVPRWSKACP